MKRGYNQTKKEAGDGFYSSQAEDFKMGKQTLLKLWELLHLLEVKGTVRYTFETKDSLSQCHIDILYKVQQGYIVLLLLSRFVVPDSVRPHRRQPTRLPHPWDPPGKNTGVGCHFLLQCMPSRFSRVWLCATLWTAARPQDSLGKNAGVGCHLSP